MTYEAKVARKHGKVICRNCGKKVMPGNVYIKSKKATYCIECDGLGKELWDLMR